MAHLKFDPAKLERLNDEGRFEFLPPDVIWGALGDVDPDVIVDIGAGTGLFARQFARMAPHARVYAVDAEPTMVSWMLDHVPDGLEGRIVPTAGEETRIPLDDDSADVAVMINVHHELAEPSATYREAARVLRVGGRIVVADWLPGNTESGPPERVRASAETIAEMLSVAGFEAIVVHPDLPRHSLLTARKG